MIGCFDPDQAQLSVGPDLGPDCLQRLSADDKIRCWQTELRGRIQERRFQGPHCLLKQKDLQRNLRERNDF